MLNCVSTIQYESVAYNGLECEVKRSRSVCVTMQSDQFSHYLLSSRSSRGGN